MDQPGTKSEVVILKGMDQFCLNILVGNHATSDVQPLEVWVTTMTPGNPKWNKNSRVSELQIICSARTTNQTHILWLF